MKRKCIPPEKYSSWIEVTSGSSKPKYTTERERERVEVGWYDKFDGVYTSNAV